MCVTANMYKCLCSLNVSVTTVMMVEFAWGQKANFYWRVLGGGVGDGASFHGGDVLLLKCDMTFTCTTHLYFCNNVHMLFSPLVDITIKITFWSSK